MSLPTYTYMVPKTMCYTHTTCIYISALLPDIIETFFHTQKIRIPFSLEISFDRLLIAKSILTYEHHQRCKMKQQHIRQANDKWLASGNYCRCRCVPTNVCGLFRELTPEYDRKTCFQNMETCVYIYIYTYTHSSSSLQPP